MSAVVARTSRQFLTYASVGIASNATLYVVYLLLTSTGIGHKSAMSLCYFAGMLMTFALNRRYTFNHDGHVLGSAVRHAVMYALMYVANLGALVILVDVMQLPHRPVVLVCILLTACIMFLMQKLWVFPEGRGPVA